MKTNIIAIFSVILFLIQSCQSVLEEEIVSGITAESHYNTPEGFQSAVNAAYGPLRSYFGKEHGTNVSVFGTDTYTKGGHGSYKFINDYTAGLNPGVASFQVIWDSFYRGINTTNTVIDRADDVEGLDEEEKNSKVAEARFLRALYYFYLVQMFGDIPLTLEETTEAKTEATKTPVAQVYEAILEDLQFAAEHLPVEQDQYGRATKPAAEHLLAKVHLTRGNEDDWSNAAAYAKKVIHEYDFELLENFEDVFDHDNELHSEVIWSVQYTNDPLTQGDGNHTHVFFRPWYEIYPGLQRSLDPGYGRMWIRYRPTRFALELFSENDSRYHATFQTVWYYNDESSMPRDENGNLISQLGDTAIWITKQEFTQEEIDSKPYMLVTWDNISENLYPSLKKYDDFKRASINDMRGSRDFIVFRLAETYLIAAEALMQAGNLTEAVEYINVVRRRAAYPGEEAEMEITEADLDIDFILNERARELLGEGHRWFDLKRTGKLVERVKAHNPDGGPNIQPYHALRPIPSTVIDRVTSDFPQNEGY